MAKASKKKPSKEKKSERAKSKSKAKKAGKSKSSQHSARPVKKPAAKGAEKSSAKSAGKNVTKNRGKKSSGVSARLVIKRPVIRVVAKKSVTQSNGSKSKSAVPQTPKKGAKSQLKPVVSMAAVKPVKAPFTPVKAPVKTLARVPTSPKISSKNPAQRPESSPVKTPVMMAVKVPLKPVTNGVVQLETKPGKKIEKPMKKIKEVERKGIPVPTPVPTDMKPAKNQVGIRTAELEHFRDMLLAKRRELVGDMSSMEREALQRGGNSNLSNLPIHMADMGTDNYEQEFTLGLMEKDRNLLREINNALAKVQDGTYGLCEGTREPISKPRLEAQPWARYSIEHARKLEQRMVRRI